MDVSCIKKNRMTREECLSYLPDCQTHVLKSAVLIGKEETSCFLNEKEEEGQTFSTAVTSTPNKENSSRKGKTLKSVFKTEFVAENSFQHPLENDTLSASKVCVLAENIRRKHLQELAANRVKSILCNEEQMSKDAAVYGAKLRAESRAKALRIKEREQQRLEEERAREAERKQQQEAELQKQAQRASWRSEQLKAIENQKRAAEAERKLIVERNLKFVQEIQQYHIQFAEIFKKIHHELIGSSDDKQALASLVAQVNPLRNAMDVLVQHCKNTNISEDDVNTAKNVTAQINSIYLGMQEYNAQIKKQQEEIEAKKLLEQHLTEASQKQDGSVGGGKECASSVGNLSDCADKDSLQRYHALRETKLNNEKCFDQLLNDTNLKKYRFDCQKAVNIPVNAISPVSASHLRDKLQKLSLLLSGQPVVIGETARVSASQHPAGIPFCKDLLAKKFVRQGASVVSSKPEAAFAIAGVVVALWQDFPDWGQLVLAHFYQDCPYLVPVFWPQVEGQSNEEYYRSLGYTYNEDGEVEKQDKFLKRMSGMMRLYAAVLISSPPQNRQSKPHPHNLSNGWRWLTSLLNLEPRPDVCATLLYDFLDVAGSSMHNQYRRQFEKLLMVIIKEYFPRLQKIAGSSAGPVVRLETFLLDILKNGSKPPKGLLPANFW